MKMNAETWSRLKEVFHAAVSRPLEERAAWLDQACGDDAELRREAESLLRAHEESGRFLETPVTGSAGGRRRGDP